MNDIDIHKYLDKIVKSKSFSHSEIYGMLLRYLTEATIKGEKPKEYTIGADVFNQKADSPATSKVRVSVHNLRKKLDLYYKKEGVEDTIQFSIPKGTYTLEFKNTKENFLKNNYQKIIIFTTVIIVMSLLLYLFSSISGSGNEKLKNTKFWKELIENNKKTIIVIGDFFIFDENNTTDRNNVSEISNSDHNVEQFADSERTNKSYEIVNRNSYIPYAAIQSLPYIIPLLDRNDVDYKIILSSNFRWETFNNYNIIYIGSLKNLNALSYLTENKLNIKYKGSNNTLTLSDKSTDEKKTYTSTINNSVTADYTLVAKLPGPSENIFYLFASNHEIGSIESIKYFTLQDSVNNFGNTRLKDARYFRGIFKAEGIENIKIQFDLIDYESITDSTLVDFWHY